MQQYVVLRDVYLGSIQVRKGDIVEVSSAGVTYGSRTDKNVNIKSAEKLNWVEVYDEVRHASLVDPEPEPVVEEEEVAFSAPAPASPQARVGSTHVEQARPSFDPSRFKVERSEDNILPTEFKSPRVPASKVAAEEVKFNRSSIEAAPDYVDHGSVEQVRATPKKVSPKKAAEQPASNDTQDGDIKIKGPKPFNRKSAIIEQG